MRKNILKRVVCIVILAGLVIGAIWGWKYYEDQQRKKQDAYFTKNKLSVSEMNVMVFFYHVKSNPEWMWDDPDKDKWPDYSNYTIEPTEDTEKVAVVLSYELANELYSTEKEAVELFKKYGFSKEKPITVEWIMDNPKKAVKIMRLIRGGTDRYYSRENGVYPAYEKIISQTENMSENTEDATSNEVESTE